MPKIKNFRGKILAPGNTTPFTLYYPSEVLLSHSLQVMITTTSILSHSFDAQPAFVPTDYLLYWKLDEGSGTNAPDHSGNGYTCFNVDNLSTFRWDNDATRTRYVMECYAESFNFSETFVPNSKAPATMDNILTTEISTNDPDGFSMCFWYRRTSLGSGFFNGGKTLSDAIANGTGFGSGTLSISKLGPTQGFIIDTYRITDGPDGDGNYIWCVAWHGSSHVDNGGTFYRLGNHNDQGDTGWLHIANTWTKSTNTLKMYINGSLVKTTVLTGSSVLPGSYVLNTSQFAPANSNVHRFKMSDVMVYGRELAATEIENIYNLTY
jgi:hypothetical protein